MTQFKRSRLVRKTDEQITKRTALLGVFAVILFISVIIFGLPFLIKFSVFLGESKSNKGDVSKQAILPPLAPRLVIPFEATNSATIKITGFAEANVNVQLVKNDVAGEKIKVSEAGDFSFDNVDLNDGDNTFSAIAMTDNGGSSEASKIINVFYNTKAPQLTMSNPSGDEISVDSADFDVIGRTDKGNSVTVNNRVAMVDDEGNFKLKLQLNSGKNNVEIIVRDSAGNDTKKNITITYSL